MWWTKYYYLGCVESLYSLMMENELRYEENISTGRIKIGSETSYTERPGFLEGSPNVGPPASLWAALWFHGVRTSPGSRDVNLNNYVEYEVKSYLHLDLNINDCLSSNNNRFLFSDDAAEAHIFFEIQGLKNRATERIRQDHKL